MGWQRSGSSRATDAERPDPDPEPDYPYHTETTMGTRLLDSLLMLLTAAAGVGAAYFAGHALSIEHGGWAWLTAGGLVVVAVLVGALTSRRIRGYAREKGEKLNA